MTAPELPLEIQGDLAAAVSIDDALPQTRTEVRQTIYGAIAALRDPKLDWDGRTDAAMAGLYWFATQDFAQAASRTGASDVDGAFDAFCDRMIREATE